jgi:RNA-directed DNA polymerase
MKAEAGGKHTAHAAEAGRNPAEAVLSAEARVAARTRAKAEARSKLMEAVVERGNLQRAYQRVVENKGAAGVDDLDVSELKAHLQRHWPAIRAKLLSGEYVPAPVRRVDIPKPQGGVRTLGIPTAVDRLIQQALNQVLQPIFEPHFSEASFGFRPGRNAHQALKAARQHVAAGKHWVVDIDLEKFFDRVNHDLLMGKLAKRIDDARVLKLIRRYLEAGMMANGLVSPRREGTPQGGPLSPLLSNIVLDALDRELEGRGLAFCRYANDCNIYVASEQAGKKLLTSLTAWLWNALKLKVNEAKSAVARPWQRTFLGDNVTWHSRPKLRSAEQSHRRLAAKVKELLRGAQGRSIGNTIDKLNPLLRGWAAYFKLADTKRALETADGWVRRKLRCIPWRQWKRAAARARNLMKCGLSADTAWRSVSNGHGPWWNAGASHMHLALPKSWFDRRGLVSLLDTVLCLQRAS